MRQLTDFKDGDVSTVSPLFAFVIPNDTHCEVFSVLCHIR